MKVSEFFRKITSRYLWGHLAAMALTILILVIGAIYGINIYTHHGESIPIPNLKHKSYADAERILKDARLQIVVSDTGYVKTLPPDCVLSQSPEAGTRVKSGHIVYITINSSHSPTITLPDIIENCSLREAMARLTAMGFKLGQPEYINGERDWVYGIIAGGRSVVAGDKIPVEETLIIQVGNGMRDANDSINYIDPVFDWDDGEVAEETVDEFEEIGTTDNEAPNED